MQLTLMLPILAASLALALGAPSAIPPLFVSSLVHVNVFPIEYWNSFLEEWTEATEGQVKVRSTHTFAKTSQRTWYGVALNQAKDTFYSCQGGDNGNDALCTLHSTALPGGATAPLGVDAFWSKGFAWDDQGDALLAVHSTNPSGTAVYVFSLLSIDASGKTNNISAVSFDNAFYPSISACGVDAKRNFHMLVSLGQGDDMSYVVISVADGHIVSQTSLPNVGLAYLYLDSNTAQMVGYARNSNLVPQNWVNLSPTDQAPRVITPNCTSASPQASYYDSATSTLFTYYTYLAGGTLSLINASGLTVRSLSVAKLSTSADTMFA